MRPKSSCGPSSSTDSPRSVRRTALLRLFHAGGACLQHRKQTLRAAVGMFASLLFICDGQATLAQPALDQSPLPVFIARMPATRPNRFRFFKVSDGRLYVTFVDNGEPAVLKITDSLDGGMTWSKPRDILNSRTIPNYAFLNQIENIVASGSDIYVTVSVEGVVAGQSTGYRLVVAVSHDTGATFSVVDIGAPAGEINTDALTYVINGTVVVLWHSGQNTLAHPGRIFTAMSIDGGRSFVPRQLSDGPSTFVAGPLSDVADGTLVAVWADNDAGKFYSRTSPDAGATWTDKVVPLNGCCIRAVARWNHTLYLVTASGIARTADRGSSWQAVSYGLHGHETTFDVTVDDNALYAIRMEAVPEGSNYRWGMWLNMVAHPDTKATEQLLGTAVTNSFQFPRLAGGSSGMIAAWPEYDSEGHVDGIEAVISRTGGISFVPWIVHGPLDVGFMDIAVWHGSATVVYGKTIQSASGNKTSLFLATTLDDGRSTITTELVTDLNSSYGEGGAINAYGSLIIDDAVVLGTGTSGEAILLAIRPYPPPRRRAVRSP
jgi:predicted neuraminidase